jgi:hypothetical protein
MATRQHIFGRAGGPGALTLAYTSPFAGGQAAGWASIEPALGQLIGAAGGLGNLYIQLEAAPTAGTSVTFTLQLKQAAGGGWEDTSVTLTIPAGETVGFVSGCVTVAVDDQVRFAYVSPDAVDVGAIIWVLEYVSSEGAGIANYGCTASIGNNAFGYHASPFGHWGWTTNFSGRAIVTTPGNLTKVRVKLDAAPGMGESRTFEVYLNEVLQETVTIADLATTGNWSGTLACAADDVLRIFSTATAGAAAALCSLASVFQSTTDGEFNLAAPNSGFLPNPGTDYRQLTNSAGGSLVESDVKLYVGLTGLVVKNLRVHSDQLSDGTFTVRRNEAATALGCVISGGATSGSDLSDSVTYFTGDRFTMQFSGSSGLNRAALWGITGVDLVGSVANCAAPPGVVGAGVIGPRQWIVFYRTQPEIAS